MSAITPDKYNYMKSYIYLNLKSDVSITEQFEAPTPSLVFQPEANIDVCEITSIQYDSIEYRIEHHLNSLSEYIM